MARMFNVSDMLRQLIISEKMVKPDDKVLNGS